jgi:DNA adenine methylase
MNEELINAFQTVETRVEALIAMLRKPYCYRYESECYYLVRALDPSLLGLTERAARTVFLNKTGFNGLYRVNAKGQFNVPFGLYTNPKICDAENLRACSTVLAGVFLQTLDFWEALRRTSEGDFVYLDPPYVPVSKTSNFTGYAKGGFNEDEQRRLASAFRKHAERGVLLMLSNSNTQLVRELYEGFDIQEVQAPRAVNSKASGRGKVTELVIRSWVKS